VSRLLVSPLLWSNVVGEFFGLELAGF
jgi:hypothetical protein